MANHKTITIIGATGNQGRSVAETFLGLPDWHVRCVTRNPASNVAVQLAAHGAEIVQANLDDEDAITTALKGTHAVFVNTDFWGPYTESVKAGNSPDESSKIAYKTEVRRAKNAAHAAAAATTLERYVYSALGPMKRASGGKYSHSFHWETKAETVDYIEKEIPELAKKTSYIYLGAYATNTLLFPKHNATTGAYQMVVPAKAMTRFPIIDPSKSTGPFVRALIEDETPCTKLLAYDSELTLNGVVDEWSRVTGKEATIVEMDLDVLHKVTGLPYEILDGPAFLSEYPYTAGIEGVITPAMLKHKFKTPSFAEFLATLDEEILLGSSLASLHALSGKD